MPYGGVKRPDSDGEGVRYAIEEMTEMKLVAYNRGPELLSVLGCRVPKNPAYGWLGFWKNLLSAYRRGRNQFVEPHVGRDVAVVLVRVARV